MKKNILCIVAMSCWCAYFNAVAIEIDPPIDYSHEFLMRLHNDRAQDKSRVQIDVFSDMHGANDIWSAAWAIALPKNVSFIMNSADEMFTYDIDISKASKCYSMPINVYHNEDKVFTNGMQLQIEYVRNGGLYFSSDKALVGSFIVDCSMLEDGTFSIIEQGHPKYNAFCGNDIITNYSADRNFNIIVDGDMVTSDYILELNKYDLNGDGEVNVGDISALYSVILRQ